MNTQEKKKFGIAFAQKLIEIYPNAKSAQEVTDLAIQDGRFEDNNEMLIVWGRLNRLFSTNGGVEMDMKELLTNAHIGKRVTIQSIQYGTISVGIYQGVTLSAWTNEYAFTFTDGFIGNFAERIFLFPLTEIDDTILLSIEVI